MLLPSGLANTRCSVCRFDPGRGSSPATLASAPGTGLESPETGRQNRRYRDLDRPQRPHVPTFEPAKMPAKCALFVRDRKTSVLIGLRGGGCSLDRTGLQPQIPAVREFYREFLQIRGRCCEFWPYSSSKFSSLQQNSRRDGTGIFRLGCGNFGEAAGIFPHERPWGLVRTPFSALHHSPAAEFACALVGATANSCVKRCERRGLIRERVPGECNE